MAHVQICLPSSVPLLSAAHTEKLLRSSGNTRQSAAKPRSTLASASSPSLSKTTPSPSSKVQPSRPHRPTTVTTPTKLSKTTGSAKHKTTTQGTLSFSFGWLVYSLIPKQPSLIPKPPSLIPKQPSLNPGLLPI